MSMETLRRILTYSKVYNHYSDVQLKTMMRYGFVQGLRFWNGRKPRQLSEVDNSIYADLAVIHTEDEWFSIHFLIEDEMTLKGIDR